MSQGNYHIIIGEESKFDRPVCLAEEDLLRHCYLLGKTGVGKTTVLLNMADQWIQQGGGMLLLDPHGDLFADTLARVPRRRISDVLVIEPGDRSVSWNLLSNVPEGDRPRVAQEVVGALKAIYLESWGPRLEHILYCAVRLVLDRETESLLGVQRLLHDKGYRHWLLKSLRDPVIRSFWVNEFETWDPRFQREAVASIQNKLGQVLADPTLRAILGQRNSSFSPRKLMDEERIVLVNLAKGVLGEMSSNLLGALLIAGFTSAALSRQEIPEEDRKTFLLLVDEFQNFTSEAFCSLLAEARKYGLAITCSHQFGSQLKESIRSAIVGNTGSHVLFRMGAEDAEYFHREYGYSFEASRFTGLASYHSITRVLQDGYQCRPVPMQTLPARYADADHSERIRKLSQEIYTRGNEKILEAQERWFQRQIRSQ